MKIPKKYLFLLSISVVLLVSFIFIKTSIKTNKEKTPPVLSEQTQKLIRNPAVAGSFYPQDKKELNEKLDTLFKQAEVAEIEGELKILIVPHAGIDYSGAVAAWGFKQVEGKDYRKVILLGASHTAYFDHTAVYDVGVWETPLGRVDIGEDLAKTLLDKEKKIISDTSSHKKEHSLEIELIFLQKVLSDFKIVPILVSQPSDELIDYLAQKISSTLDDQTLLVISTDLSHYPSWEDANKVDQEVISSILTGKKENLEKTVKNIESKNYKNLVTTACGYQPLRVALKAAEILKLEDFKKIKYENSGITGDKSRVVGYVAIGVWGEKIDTASSQLDEQVKKQALKIAKDTLYEYINNNKVISVTSENKTLLQALGAFVTLKKKGQLRGCIGRFEPNEPLYQVIQDMTIAASSQDSRFPPVKVDELKDITIEISVMSPKKRINNWKEIILGKHGVVIQKEGRSGTFLPQVATETGWSLEEFLGQLCAQKIGLSPDCYKDQNTIIYTFEAQVFGEE